MTDSRAAYALGEPVTIVSNPHGTFVTVETAEGHTTGSWDTRLLTLADPPITAMTGVSIEAILRSAWMGPAHGPIEP